MPFAWSDGADLTKDGGKALQLRQPRGARGREVLPEFFTDGISDKAAPATPTTEPDFVSGKVPMFISGPWMMSAVEKVGGAGFKDKYGVMPMPAKKRSSSFVGGSDFAVFKNTKNRDSAWKFVQWLARARRPGQVVQACRPTCRRSRAPGRTRHFTADKKLAVFGKQLETAKAPPSFPTWEQVVDRVRHRDGEGHQAAAPTRLPR